MHNSSLLFVLHALALLSLTLLFLRNVPAILRGGDSLKPAYVLLLSITIILGIWLRFDHNPHGFKVFYVEYEINNVAQMIAGENDFSNCVAGTVKECEDREPPIYGTGFPFIGAAAMRLTGKNSPGVLFTLNSVLGALCIPVIFIMAMAATGSARSALFASFAASILPLNVILSGNATTETADLLFLCITFTFLFFYVKNKDPLSGVGLFSAIVFSVLVEPRNAYTAAFILIVLLATANRDKKKIVAALAGAALLTALIFVLPPVYRSIFALPSGEYLGVLKTNVRFLVANPFIPLYVTIPLVIAPVFLGRRCGVSRPLIFFFITSILAITLFDFSLPQGDFSRYVLPATIPIMLFFGITTDWVLESIKSVSLRNGLVALCLVLFLFSSFNGSFVVLRDFMEAQDDFISKNLPEVVGDCSVFSPNSSVGMTYVKNPSYEIDRLLDDSFLKEHSECKIVIFEVQCAAGQREECQRVYDGFSPEELSAESIFGFYNVIISRIPAGSTVDTSEDSEKL